MANKGITYKKGRLTFSFTKNVNSHRLRSTPSSTFIDQFGIGSSIVEAEVELGFLYSFQFILISSSRFTCCLGAERLKTYSRSGSTPPSAVHFSQPSPPCLSQSEHQEQNRLRYVPFGRLWCCFLFSVFPPQRDSATQSTGKKAPFRTQRNLLPLPFQPPKPPASSLPTNGLVRMYVQAMIFSSVLCKRSVLSLPIIAPAFSKCHGPHRHPFHTTSFNDHQTDSLGDKQGEWETLGLHSFRLR